MIVVWRVTERCNLGCKFCAYDRNLVRPRHDAAPDAIRRFGALLAGYQRETGDPVLVSWLGGEPLRWAPLAPLTRLFHAAYGLRLGTTTNGTPLESTALRAHLLDHYAELTVSVDALGADHDRLRGAPGLFEQVRASVRQLVHERAIRGRALKLRANVVLLRHTVGQFAELCRELAAWGVTEITFNALGGRDRPEFFPANRLRPEQVLAFAATLPALRAELQASDVSLLGGEGYLARLYASAADLPLPVKDCAPGESFLFVDEAGRVAPCSFTAEEYGVSLDQLRSVAELQQLPLHFSRTRLLRPSASCHDCPSTYVFAKFAAVTGS